MTPLLFAPIRKQVDELGLPFSVMNSVVCFPVHLVKLCNWKEDNHRALPVSPHMHSFCIFSLSFSQDGSEIMGGSNDGAIYVYDMEADKLMLKVRMCPLISHKTL